MPKVLVVDDSLSVRKVVEKALEGRGLQVLAAASGSEAIEMLEKPRGSRRLLSRIQRNVPSR